jgi:hypothetical protein
MCIYTKKESIDLFNYYNHRENCQYIHSLFLLYVYVYMYSEAVAAVECESMMMMIEQ